MSEEVEVLRLQNSGTRSAREQRSHNATRSLPFGKRKRRRSPHRSRSGRTLTGALNDLVPTYIPLSSPVTACMVAAVGPGQEGRFRIVGRSRSAGWFGVESRAGSVSATGRANSPCADFRTNARNGKSPRLDHPQ